MTILYLGSDPARFKTERGEDVLHFPLLEIVPRPLDHPHIISILDDLPQYTHCIFTSKHAVALSMRAFGSSLNGKKIIAIGASTAAYLQQAGIVPSIVAQEESQEGIIARLRLMDWEETTYVLMPRSSMARSALENFFLLHGIRHQVCDLYDTRPRDLLSLPPLDGIDEIVFTSPSTVHAFRKLYPVPPLQKQLTPIGPITAEALRCYTSSFD